MSGITRSGFVLLALLGAPSCGGNQPLARPNPPVTVGVPADDGMGTVDVRLTREDAVLVREIPASRTALWALITGVYEEVGLREPQLDRANWTAVLQNHSATRRIGREPMSTFFNCGAGATGPNANTRRIRMTVQTAIESLASGDSRAHTRIDAVAYSLEGTSGTPMVCATTGALENRINNTLAVRANVGR